MTRFADGTTPLLVATTVIEVGVDVPEANIMVIEHAERFGLAQMHQLRGRVGRGRDRSSCLLLYRAPLGEVAKARLAMLRETEDGFRIAEADLPFVFDSPACHPSAWRGSRCTPTSWRMPDATRSRSWRATRD